MTDPPPLPLSPELIAHHAGLHPCDDADMVEVVCPCGDAVALSCSACGQAVFFSTRPGTWCEHARRLWESAR